MEFAVLGGDMRQIRLAEWLAGQGYHTVTWGLEHPDNPRETDLTSALKADCIILPLPVSRDGIHLNLSFGREPLRLTELWSNIQGDRKVLGGMIGRSTLLSAREHGVVVTDYYAVEELQIRNAVTTAEGALRIAMEESGRSLCGRHCLVVGFGRIGKILAHRLRGLNAEVTVSARKSEDLAWIEAMGYRPVRTGNLAEVLPETELLFNTVPAVVLGEKELILLNSETLLLELASEPGGIDLDAADRLRKKFVVARGLPGRLSPRTAGEDIGRAVCSILEERGT